MWLDDTASAFQSTLPRGERPTSGSSGSLISHFNPRSHEGSDSSVFRLITVAPSISIHAPTRGATFCCRHCYCICIDFNPRSHEGSDKSEMGTRRCLHISIHAPTRGATMIPVFRLRHFLYFNPRSHEGSDLSMQVQVHGSGNFNPRSHEGSDVTLLLKTLICLRISIHAPTRGATN